MNYNEHIATLKHLKRILLRKYEEEDYNSGNGFVSLKLHKDIDALKKVIEIVENSN